MNNAIMWLVVKPTVGVPLFLSAVVVGSFAVHVAVPSRTNWYNDYLAGKPLTTAAATPLEENQTAEVSYVPDGTQQVPITMPDGSTARAILVMPDASTLN